MIIAFDYGEKRIGVAVSNETQRYAIALKYISNNIPPKSPNRNKKNIQVSNTTTQGTQSLRSTARLEKQKLFNKMLHYINYYYPEKIIVGIPKIIDPQTKQITEGRQAKVIRRFFESFNKFLVSKKIFCPIEYVDETLTSQIAIHNLKSMNLSRKNIIKNADSESARILLQEYLDKLR